MKARFLLSLALITGGLLTSSVVYAATPTLSLSGTGTDSATATITGDSNSTVVLWYNIGSSAGAATKILGTTNNSGQLSTTITVSTLTPALDTTKNVYLMVAGQQSVSQAWSSSASGSTGFPSLSQSSITINIGQTTTVTSQGSSASVYVLSNTSPAIASVSTSGNQITVTGSQVGTTQVSICYTGNSSNCVTLAITVNTSGSSNSNSSSITFNPSAVTVAAGQSISVGISGGASYYVSMNSNPGITSHTLNGSIITINGVTTGSTNLTICTLTGVCAALPVTVGSGTTTATTGATVSAATTFSNANPTLTPGQTITVVISGSATYYISANTNQIPVQASIAANLLTLTGVTAGTTALTICPSGGTTGCSTMNVTVGGTATAPTTTAATTAPVTTTSAPIVVAPTTTTNNSASLLTTIQTMQSQLAQIALAVQTMQSQLNQIVKAFATVVPSSVSAAPLNTSATASFSGKFVSLLSSGSTGPEVTALQKKLIAGGFLSGEATGYFGAATQAAVKKFQIANNIEATGYTGPGTRAALSAQ